MERKMKQSKASKFWIWSIVICMGVTLISFTELLGWDIRTDQKEGIEDAIMLLRNIIPGVETARINGTVYDQTGETVLDDVTVAVKVGDQTYETKTGEDGTFILTTGPVDRSVGYNLTFTKDQLVANRSLVFVLSNLRIDMGDVRLYPQTQSTCQVSGQVLDDFSSSPLSGAEVSFINSQNQTISTMTDASGEFVISDDYFQSGSTYAFSITKSQYLPQYATVTISEESNTIDQNPVHLYLSYGAINGTIMDDESGSPLALAMVTVKDSQNNTICANTDQNGQFQLTSPYLHLGQTYSVTVSKENYSNETIEVTLNLPGENTISSTPISLNIAATITGKVVSTVNAPVSGAHVTTTDSAGNTFSEDTDANGIFTLTGMELHKSSACTLNFTHDNYENKSLEISTIIQGTNDVGTVTLDAKLQGSGSHTISGRVINSWDTSQGLTANVLIKDHDNIDRTAICDSYGNFSVSGIFIPNIAYVIYVSMTNYTGEQDSAHAEKIVTISQNASQYVGNIPLYPTGIFFKINGQSYGYQTNLKQTWEKFLTEKTGFTFTARNTEDLDTASAIYLHTDDIIQLPHVPGDVQSSYIAVNGNTKSAAITSGTLSDERTHLPAGPRNHDATLPSLKMSNSVMHHFLITDTGTFTIETNGEIAPYLKLELLNGNGETISSVSNSANSNANISQQHLQPGWYFVKVSGVNDTIYGVYNIGITGTEQVSGSTGTWTTDNLILSWYDTGAQRIYIAGKDEEDSTGTIDISMMGGFGKLARGTFSGTLRAVDTTNDTIDISNGFFNVIRSE
jgi:hypothetical protein